ncbi:deoxynucleoside kinase [Candidatus Woesearchaeota archaeon]|nr:deoxynucleoside kinase [Candidatus Woesearchaeota archaeon]
MKIYFSGPHGAGKSSLIRGLCSHPDFISYPDRLKFAKVDEPYIRQKSKIAKIFQEYCDQLNFEKQHPGKIVLGDRCIYDCLIYANAYEKLGWITKQENKKIKQCANTFDDCKPDNVVVLNPPYETLVKHIKQRWKKSKKKYREDNFNYLKAVHEEFKQFPFQGNLLYLDEILTVEQEVDKALEWILHKVYKPESSALIYA